MHLYFVRSMPNHFVLFWDFSVIYLLIDFEDRWDALVFSGLQCYAGGLGFNPGPRQNFILGNFRSRATDAHSSVMSRPGFYLVEGTAARERTGHHPHMPRPRNGMRQHHWACRSTITFFMDNLLLFLMQYATQQSRPETAWQRVFPKDIGGKCYVMYIYYRV